MHFEVVSEEILQIINQSNSREHFQKSAWKNAKRLSQNRKKNPKNCLTDLPKKYSIDISASIYKDYLRKKRKRICLSNVGWNSLIISWRNSNGVSSKVPTVKTFLAKEFPFPSNSQRKFWGKHGWPMEFPKKKNNIRNTLTHYQKIMKKPFKNIRGIIQKNLSIIAEAIFAGMTGILVKEIPIGVTVKKKTKKKSKRPPV